MSTFVLAAAVGAVAVTGLLTLLLYRMNAPALDDARRDGDHDGDGGSGDGGGDGGDGANETGVSQIPATSRGDGRTAKSKRVKS